MKLYEYINIIVWFASQHGSQGSNMSLYSISGLSTIGKMTVVGEIKFGLEYDYRDKSLSIYIHQCRGIAAVDVKRSRSNP